MSWRPVAMPGSSMDLDEKRRAMFVLAVGPQPRGSVRSPAPAPMHARRSGSKGRGSSLSPGKDSRAKTRSSGGERRRRCVAVIIFPRGRAGRAWSQGCEEEKSESGSVPQRGRTSRKGAGRSSPGRRRSMSLWATGQQRTRPPWLAQRGERPLPGIASISQAKPAFRRT